MVTFLYWNINRRPIGPQIRALVESHRVDILVLSEFAGSPVSMQQHLNSEPRPEYHYATGNCERVHIFTRFSPEFLTATYESERISIRRLTLPARLEILVVAVHLPSKLFASEDSQTFECEKLARTIREQEERVGHARTLIVGDLNMNPFEKGLVKANALNAVMSQQVASRGSRVVQSEKYPFFFNPMWAHLGHRVGHPPGTYFYDRGDIVNYYWNVFDQVIVRPELMDHFDPERIRVLTEVGEESLLLDDGRPDQQRFSDHLPLLFEIEL